jgi:hypothetical protein
MTDAKPPATLSDRNDNAKTKPGPRANDHPVKAAPPPAKQPKPGRRPLFRT